MIYKKHTQLTSVSLTNIIIFCVCHDVAKLGGTGIMDKSAAFGVT